VTKGQLAVLWGLAVVILLILAALTYLLSGPLLSVQLSEKGPASGSVPQLVGIPTGVPTGVSTGVPTGAQIYLLPETPHSARSLYDRAEQAAKEWRPDAGLVSAAASWPFATLDQLSGPVDWTLSFFSPGTQSVHVLNVHQNQITPIRETLSPYPLPVMEIERWRVDSHEALNAWLNGGGGDFLRSHSVVDVSARLRLEDGQLVWSVIGSGPEGQPAWGVLLDAVDGDRVR
jgi:hypothetical protein